MMEAESGTFPSESLSSARIESLARHVYTLARVPIRQPPGTRKLWQALVGPCVIHKVDVGMEPGTALVEFVLFRDASGEECGGASSIRLLARQTPQQMTLAYAHACALYVAWADSVPLPIPIERAVALAIVMPELAFREELSGPLTFAEIARSFVVTVDSVSERARMLRGTHDSCERAAFPSNDG